MNKNRKTLYIAVLAIGGAVLLFDIITGGATSPAESEAAQTAPTVTVEPAQAPSPRKRSSSHVRATIAGTLHDYEQGRPIVYERIDDAFALLPQWIPAAPETDETEAEPQPAEPERPDFKLTGVVASGETRYAIIDGNVLAVGKSYKDWKLIGVEPYRAIFSRDDVIAAVEMPRPDIDKSGDSSE